MKHADFREVFSSSDSTMPLKELQMVGWVRSSKARVPGLPAHEHKNAFEFFFIERGNVEWWVEEEIHRVAANSVFINRPGERHGSTGHSMKPCGYFFIILSVAPGELPGMTRAQSAAVKAALERMSLRNFPASNALKAHFRMLWKLHREPPPFVPELAVRAHLHLLLVHLLADYQGAIPAIDKRKKSYAIGLVIRAIHERLHEIKCVADLARIAKLNITQFSERFLGETGFTPASYLRQQRVETVKRLLIAGGQSMAEIALSTGFSSSQNLATIFKQVEGMPPSEFAKRSRSEMMPR